MFGVCGAPLWGPGSCALKRDLNAKASAGPFVGILFGAEAICIGAACGGEELGQQLHGEGG